MKILFTIIITIAFQLSYSQPEHLKDFYPENQLFKSLKVRRVIDSFYINYPSVRTQFYDTAGRLIGDLNYFVDSLDNPFIYIQEKDTLYRLKYRYPQKGIYSFEKFVFNNGKKLIEYVECRNSYNGDSTILVNMHLFGYDNFNRLKEQVIFRSWNYSEKVKERMNIKKQELEFIDRYTYKYLKAGNFLIIVANHSKGNRSDTLIYNQKNQLTKQNLFARHGTLGGEQSAEYVNDITVRRYRGNSTVEKQFTTFCFAVKANGDCFMRKQFNEGSKEEKITDKNGLLIEKYSYYSDGRRVLTDKYFHDFHK